MLLRIPKALIVDDDPVARGMVTFSLQQEGFTCIAANNGDEAIRLFEFNTFDIVVTDLCMPNMHGHALVVKLRSRKEVPLIVVHSSVDDPRLIREMMILGVNEILRKPSDYCAFAERTRAVVNQRHQLLSETASDNAPQSRGSDGEAEALSSAAVDVFVTSRSESCDNHALIATVMQCEALAAEVMKIASGPVYQRNNRRISNIRDAVALLGRQKVCEIALQQLKR